MPTSDESPPPGGPPPDTAVTTAAPPPASTALKEGEPPDVTLPAPPAASPTVDAEQAARRLLRLDRILAAITLGLAFLLASFPARNSDIWAHLAAGRALLHDGFAFGTDPFLYTTAGLTWVNHSWLYDLLSYGLYQLLGGPGLVVLKALLVAVLAGFLLDAGGGRRNLWAAAVCTALALVAMGPRLQLQPVCVSYLLLAVTVWFLERRRRLAAEGGASGFASYWPLLVVFVLWVNLDTWFFLGPLTVALYWLGDILSSVTAPAGARRPAHILGLVALAGLAVCLLNPYHVRAFDVLSLLSPSDAVARDPHFGAQFVSPLAAFWARPERMLFPSSMAYLALVFLGLLSFPLSGAGWPGWQVSDRMRVVLVSPRLLVWLGFFLLSAWQVRAMPFFAVVAAPILALNLRDYAARRAAAARPDRVYRRVLVGRWVTVVAGVLLLATVWQGLVQGQPLPVQRWYVEPDPALTRLADQLARWRQGGQLAAGANGFNFSPEAGNYFAWAAPEKAFADGRLADFPAVAGEYAAVRRGVEGELKRRAKREPSARARTDYVTAVTEQLDWAEHPPAGPDGEEWRGILRRHRVNHVVLYDADFVRLVGPLEYFFTTPAEWPLLYLDGHVAVFGWRDPQRAGGPDPFADLRLDLSAAAFHPPEDRKAPPRGPGRGPEVRPWWNLLRPPPPIRPLAADEAGMYSLYFDTLSRTRTLRNTFGWLCALPAGLVGLGDPRACAAAAPLVPLGQQGVARLVHGFPPRPREGQKPTPLDQLPGLLRTGYLQTQDNAPLALPLLAVRAARRAVAENPDDVGNYLVLAEAYSRLAYGTRERTWGKDLRQLRAVQLVTALHHALQASPNALQAAKAHEQLVLLSLRLNYHDVALKHLQEQLRYTRAAGPRRGQPPRQFEQQIETLTKAVKDFEKAVAYRQGDYEENAGGLRPHERARLALSRGLAAKALEVLLASDVSVFGAEGAQMQLELMLTTGRVHDARTLLEDEELKGLVGAIQYHWLRVQAAAALGDYAGADREMAAAQQAATLIPHGEQAPTPALAEIGFAVGEVLLNGLAEDRTPLGRIQGPLARFNVLQRLGHLVQIFRTRSDLGVLRGLLALERGETGQAEGYFRDALALWGQAGKRAPWGIDFAARPVAEDCLALIRHASKNVRADR